MGKRIYITPDTSIEEEIKPILMRKIQDDKLVNEVLEVCQNIKSHLRSSSINTPSFQQHITRTLIIENTHFIIQGSMKKPSLFKRIFDLNG
jgi:hypothetical protein